MPPSEFRAPELPEPGKDVGNIGHGGMNARVEAQFSQSDVSQAHQYFAPKADAGLPNLNIHSDGGASASVAHLAGGGEHAIGSIAQAGSHAALGAVIPPGGEPVSPLIQMIMKMPGLTGTISSFFEFIGALFHGNLMDALNPANWAESAMDAINSMADNAQNLFCSMDIVQSGVPTLSFDGMGFHPAGSLDGMNMHADGVSPAGADAANVGAPDSNVSMEQAIFEKTGGYKITEFPKDSMLGDWHHPQEVALNGDSNVYRPTMGGYYQSSAPAPTTTAAPASGVPNVHGAAHHAPAAHHAQAAHHDGGHSPDHADSKAAHHDGGHRSHNLSHVKIHDVALDGRGTEVAQAPAGGAGASSDYTINQGDSLWDIAKRQLGDGSRWGEIYKANADVIGSNPDLIQPGTTLHLPDGSGTNIASAGGEAGGYTVQPGDNLWSIAKHHMGSGHHWGQIYHANEGLIGGNPEMIHPGQHLAMNGAGGGDVSHVAHAPHSPQVAHAGHTTHAPHTPHTQHAPQADHTHLASNPAHMESPSPSAQMTTVTSDASVTGASASHTAGLQAETPQLAPLDGSTPASAGSAAAAGVPSASAAPVAGTYHPASFSHSASVGSEHTIDSSTTVPAAEGG